MATQEVTMSAVGCTVMGKIKREPRSIRRVFVIFLVAVAFFAGGPGNAFAKDSNGKKLTKQEKRRQKAIRKEMERPISYIITPEERAAFKKLTTDDEREQFIEAFWERRNPNPGSPENEFKE